MPNAKPNKQYLFSAHGGRGTSIQRTKMTKTKTQNRMQMACVLAPGPTHNTRTRTHPVFGILVGAGIQQQPRAARETKASGKNQRRPSVRLRIAQICQNV